MKTTKKVVVRSLTFS